MDRTIPFDENEICDNCGEKGAYDFMGDYFCDKCTRDILEATLKTMDKTVENYKKGIVSEPIDLSKYNDE